MSWFLKRLNETNTDLRVCNNNDKDAPLDIIEIYVKQICYMTILKKCIAYNMIRLMKLLLIFTKINF